MKSVAINSSGRITLPAELRRRHGWKAGDRILVSENAKGEVVLSRMPTVAELAGSFKLPPGVEADPDFGNIIDEAMEDAAERLVSDMLSGHEAEDERSDSDGRGILAQPPAMLTVEELDGILPALEREVDDDFGNLIREATREAMERRDRPEPWSLGGEPAAE